MKTALYIMKFNDGALYVGITSMALRSRMHSHKNSPCNWGIAKRARGGVGGVAEIVAFYKTREAAEAAELKLINTLNYHHGDKLLNRRGKDYGVDSGNPPLPHGIHQSSPSRVPFMYHNRKPRKNMPRTSRDTRCSVCRVIKRAAEFHSDGSRFNGLCSRCSECQNAISRQYKRAHRKGECVSTAYRAARAALSPQ